MAETHIWFRKTTVQLYLVVASTELVQALFVQGPYGDHACFAVAGSEFTAQRVVRYQGTLYVVPNSEVQLGQF